MNYFILILIIFIVVYLFLNWFAKTSSKKISKYIRLFIIFFSVLLAFLMFYAGRYIFSLPFLLAILPLIKTKAGITLLQLIRIWGLLRVLKSSGRFNFNNFNQANNTQNMKIDEAFKILNLDQRKKITKEDINKAYTKIQKKIHPDVSPETARLSSLVNEARDILMKEII